MTNRRNFLKYAGAFSLGSLLLPACGTREHTGQAAEGAPGAATGQATRATGNLGPIGFQLYSVRDVIEQDLRGTLQRLAEIGYQEVESYPGKQGHYFGMEPNEFSSMLQGMGMNLVSSHFGSGSPTGQAESWRQATMLHGFEELAGKAAEAGQAYLTCSSLHQDLRRTPDDLKRTADLFNQTGEICRRNGLQFAYHNHAFEFERVGDFMTYDFLLENTDAELVKYELDIFWVVAGGHDPIAYFNKYPDRFPLGHVKDMSREDPKMNAVIGAGSIDYSTILQAAQERGMEHFFVEHENNYVESSLETMRLNYNYLSSLTV
jgi:sugar phosphate isomerase/epimerase